MEYNFKCIDCGREFDTPTVVKEDRGECWGIPAYENVCVCPFCGGDFLTVEEYEEEYGERENECDRD